MSQIDAKPKDSYVSARILDLSKGLMVFVSNETKPNEMKRNEMQCVCSRNGDEVGHIDDM